MIKPQTGASCCRFPRVGCVQAGFAEAVEVGLGEPGIGADIHGEEPGRREVGVEVKQLIEGRPRFLDPLGTPEAVDWTLVATLSSLRAPSLLLIR